jgi:hypothetical protein
VVVRAPHEGSAAVVHGGQVQFMAGYFNKMLGSEMKKIYSLTRTKELNVQFTLGNSIQVYVTNAVN